MNIVAAVIACSATKAARPCPAADLYTSPLFRLSRQYVERIGCPWFILSAKHGLVEPTREVEPYDVTLAGMNRQERERWAVLVAEDLGQRFPSGGELLALAGRLYLPTTVTSGFRISTPLAGLPIGRRLQRLRQLLTSSRAQLQG